MFFVLNLRNILDNFVKFGLQFHRAPADFMSLDALLAIFSLILFPFTEYLIEKIKFNKFLPRKLCVQNILSLEYVFCGEYDPYLPFQYQILLNVLANSFEWSIGDDVMHSSFPQISQLLSS